MSYTAKMKMAAHLLDSVGATLRADSGRLRLWIHNRPIEGALQSIITPRDRQQKMAEMRGRTLRVLPPKLVDKGFIRPREQKFMVKARSS
jgi:hypothetical protein